MGIFHVFGEPRVKILYPLGVAFEVYEIFQQLVENGVNLLYYYNIYYYTTALLLSEARQLV